jgi:hypothetical protein
MAALVAAGTASAQPRKAAGDGERRLNAKPLDPDQRKTFQQLLKGNTAVEPGHKAILQQQAQYLVYRVTHEEIQFKKFQSDGTTSGETMKMVQDEVARNIAEITPTPKKPLSENQLKFVREFAKEVAAAVKEVLKNEAAIARVNAAIILAKFAETGVDELADPLCDIVEAKDADDAVRHYGLRGLENLYAAKPGERVRPEEREARCAKAVIDFLHRKPPADLSSRPPEEAEAIRFVRRQGLRALGRSGLPAVGRRQKIEQNVAVELLRFMTGTAGVEPPPSVTEQAEAAIGLCQMQRKFWPDRPDYQVDYAVYQVARFVVEFANQYDRERNQPTATDWKYTAYRLAQALDELKKESEVNAYVGKVADRAKSVLNGIVAGGAADQLSASTWLDANQPDKKELFKGLPETAVKAPAAAEG